MSFSSIYTVSTDNSPKHQTRPTRLTETLLRSDYRAGDLGGIVEGISRYRFEAQGVHQDGWSSESSRGHVSWTLFPDDPVYPADQS